MTAAPGPGRSTGRPGPHSPRRARGETTGRKGRIRRNLLTLSLAATIAAGTVSATNDAPMLHKIHHQVRTVHRYQAALGTCCRRYHHRAERTRSLAFRRWLLDFWRGHADHARRRWKASPVRANLLCIHGGEGPWNDPDPPFWGGLQMDASFQATYGPEFLRAEGTADHWTPLQQLTAGARAVRVRGYTPWPNTGRVCGLL